MSLIFWLFFRMSSIFPRTENSGCPRFSLEIVGVLDFPWEIVGVLDFPLGNSGCPRFSLDFPDFPNGPRRRAHSARRRSNLSPAALDSRKKGRL